MKPSLTPLSTVAEEDIDMGSVNYGVGSIYRSSQDSLKNCQFNGISNIGNGTENFKGYNSQIQKEYMLTDNRHTTMNKTTECNEKGFKISSTCDTASRNDMYPDNNCVMAMTPCPSLVTDKCSKDLTLSSNLLECAICKSKVHCLCKNCSSLRLPQWEKREVVASHNHDDDDTNCEQEEFPDPDIHEEFIDDNFEDMESIASGSDEVTNSKS